MQLFIGSEFTSGFGREGERSACRRRGEAFRRDKYARRERLNASDYSLYSIEHICRNSSWNFIRKILLMGTYRVTRYRLLLSLNSAEHERDKYLN